jgi:tRNA G18 (ribose-2'-O)-methylase SpoU
MMRTVATAIFIDDPADARLADYRALTDVELRKRTEPAEGIFIAEGELVIDRALRAGYPMRSALTSERWLLSIADLVADTDAPVFVGSEALLEGITGFHVHRGALASMGRLPLPSVPALVTTATHLVVLENVNSHTNIGAIFRCAAGLGMDAVLLNRSCADPLYRRSVRVSMGEVFALPYARFDTWPGGLDELVTAGFKLLALTPDESAEPIGTVAERLASDDEKLALLLGAEGMGLSSRALAMARPVRIPMSAGVDSLNVAAATAVACYALRRR